MAKNRRQNKRARDIGNVIEQAIQAKADDEIIHSVDDKSLFQIDERGTPQTSLSRKLAKRQKLAAKDPMIYSTSAWKSKNTACKVQKAVTVSENSVITKSEDSLSPIWSSSEPKLTRAYKRRQKIKSTNHKVQRVQIPAPGQSYHPEFHAHQEIVAKAFAEQLERDQSSDQDTTVNSNSISHLIRQNSNSSEDDSEEEHANIPSLSPKKTPKVVTQAKRNKRLRHKILLKEHANLKTKAKLSKQINDISAIIRTVNESEEQFFQRQQVKLLLKQQKLEEDPKVRVGNKRITLDRETVVPFASELKGSFRSIQPKGSLALDCFDSLHKRNLFTLNSKTRPRKPRVKYIEK